MSKYVRDSEWGVTYKNFSKKEFMCPCCSSYGNGIAKSLLDVMQKLRDKYGNTIVTSGYRCYNKNVRVGGTNNSKHLKGMACDFYFGSGILVNQNKRIEVVNEIKRMPFVNYTYCNVNGNYPGMGSAIHVDTILIDVDTYYLQVALNKDYKANLEVDGLFGPKTEKSCKDNYLYFNKNAKNHIKWLQERLNGLGYYLEVDGYFGNQTLKCVKRLQSDRGLVVDGYVGPLTHKELLK